MIVNDHDSSITVPKGESMPTDCYKKERLRQSSTNFNVGHWLTLVGAFIFLTNPLLLLSGNISVAEAQAVGKLAFVAFESGRKLCKDANDRLDKAIAASEDEESE
ncbi:MAG: hypothetical protein WA828_17980 [Coleofasciculaceae cyanobacterium]